jgi:hypothetical protein
MTPADVREAFRLQAGHCRGLGSPFTALLCDLAGERLTETSEVGRRILRWPRPADATADSVPLRLAGALHALAASGLAPELANAYPPNPTEPEALWAAVTDALNENDGWLCAWLNSAPQTNEVARSSLLMAGLLVVAHRFRQPLALYELGASAGLNLLPDLYAYDLGGEAYGQTGSALELSPTWTGPTPPHADLKVVSRRGVDLSPLDVTSAEDRARLRAYVWADQADRVARLDAALGIAEKQPPKLDQGDAAAWIETTLDPKPEAGVTRVVTHTIAFQYFPPETQARIVAHIAKVGAEAAEKAPFAWLRFEIAPDGQSLPLTLTTWPGGEETVLATGDAHGRAIQWVAFRAEP